MGRDRILSERVRVNVWINRALVRRLQSYQEEFGMTRRQIMEQALAIWLNNRDQEAK